MQGISLFLSDVCKILMQLSLRENTNGLFLSMYLLTNGLNILNVLMFNFALLRQSISLAACKRSNCILMIAC